MASRVHRIKTNLLSGSQVAGWRREQRLGGEGREYKTLVRSAAGGREAEGAAVLQEGSRGALTAKGDSVCVWGGLFR